MKRYLIGYTFFAALFFIGTIKFQSVNFYSYPNLIPFLGSLILLIPMFFWIRKMENRIKKVIIGIIIAMIYLFCSIVANRNYGWYPTNYPFPPKKQSVKVDYEPYDWKIASPQESGIDTTQLNRFLSSIDNWDRLLSLLVIKNDNLIIEKYCHGTDKYCAFNIKSITKSITSALIGISIDKGFIENENCKVVDYFPEYYNKLNDERKNDITIDHLLTMTGGFEHGREMVTIKSVFQKSGLSNVPGTQFQYHSGSHQILSGIISKTSKLNTKQFAKKYLFEPLGIKIGFMRKYGKYYCGFGDSYFTSRDIARFGYLYLKKGNINGQQIIDSSWIEKSIIKHVEFEQNDENRYCYQDLGYGYSWWITRIGNHNFYAGHGYRGQLLLISDELNMVLVIIHELSERPNIGVETNNLCKLINILDD